MFKVVDSGSNFSSFYINDLLRFKNTKKSGATLAYQNHLQLSMIEPSLHLYFSTKQSTFLIAV